MQHKRFYNGNFITLGAAGSFAGELHTEGEWVRELLPNTRGGPKRAATAAAGRTGLGTAARDGASEEVDLGGAFVVPGFNDNHLHALVMGDHAAYPHLGGLGEREIIERLHAHFGALRPGETVIGFGWDYPDWPEPHRSRLDAEFPDNPVALFQFSGHGACVNTAMLKQLGFDRRRGDPPGGRIMRERGGSPTGVLTDAAVEPLHYRRFAELNRRPRLATERLRFALGVFAMHGITSVQDNTWNPLSVWWLNRLFRAGELSCRFSCWPSGMRRFGPAAMRFARYRPGRIERGPVKYFLDGAFSTRTAWLLEPYEGEPQNYGTPVLHGSALKQVLLRCARMRRRAAFHAIGDRAVKEFLNVLETVADRHPVLTGLRLRLEHAQLIDPADIPRLRELGVLIAAQPHALSSPEKDRALIGAERAERAYPYRSLLDAGVPLSFGSDAPAEGSIDPFRAIRYTTCRGGAQRITVEEALRCYTQGGAYAEGAEHSKGTLDPGMRADFVVLSHNPLQLPPAELEQIRVLGTYLGGREVFRAHPDTPAETPRPSGASESGVGESGVGESGAGRE